MENKAWMRPRLIVLTRNRSEEAVLSNCKFSSLGGPSSLNNGCLLTTAAPCDTLCAAQVVS
jgi:hypothetical protein